MNFRTLSTSTLLSILCYTTPTYGHAPSNLGIIPFSTFDVGNHSYTVGFHEDFEGFCYGRIYKAPQPFYEDMIARCGHLGNFMEPASRDTQQMLISSRYNNCGRDYIFADTIDREEPVQRCLVDFEKAGGGRGRELEDEKGVGNGAREMRPLVWGIVMLLMGVAGWLI